MAAEISFSCSCSQLQGVLREPSPPTGPHVVCYCRDCQAFPHALGVADKVLNAHGGTQIFQTSPARMEIVAGRQRLACLRLTPKGLLRWYASCCNTPVGNTLPTAQLPFVGFPVSAISPTDRALLGPIAAGVNGRSARGDRASLIGHDRGPLWLLFRGARLILGSRLQKDWRRNPFFDDEGRPSVTPRILSQSELREAEAARDAQS